MPWDKIDTDEDAAPHQEQDEAIEKDDLAKNTEEAPKTEPVEKEQENADETHQAKEEEDGAVAKRKAGKQLGAPGYGREQKIALTAVEPHYPLNCACCGYELKRDAAKAYTAFESLDLEWADLEKPGIRLTNTQHIYYETVCQCGHCTQEAPHRQVSHVLTP